jgi:hypothetical protein
MDDTTGTEIQTFEDQPPLSESVQQRNEGVVRVRGEFARMSVQIGQVIYSLDA